MILGKLPLPHTPLPHTPNEKVLHSPFCIEVTQIHLWLARGNEVDAMKS